MDRQAAAQHWLSTGMIPAPDGGRFATPENTETFLAAVAAPPVPPSECPYCRDDGYECPACGDDDA